MTNKKFNSKGRTGVHDKDPKDTEIYPAPPTHHTIVCRYCNKQSRESLRYRISCLRCREKAKHSNVGALACSDLWNSWTHTPGDWHG